MKHLYNAVKQIIKKTNVQLTGGFGRRVKMQGEPQPSTGVAAFMKWAAVSASLASTSAFDPPCGFSINFANDIVGTCHDWARVTTRAYRHGVRVMIGYVSRHCGHVSRHCGHVS